MKNLLLILTVFSGGISSVLAQAKPASVPTAPIEWKSYKDSSLKVSAAFPKMPMKLLVSGNDCDGAEKHSLYAYARLTVYELTLTRSSGEKAPDWCESPAKFDAARIFEALRSSNSAELRATTENRKQFRASSALGRSLVVLDTKQKIVIELRVHAHFPERAETERFFSSLDTTGTATADAFVTGIKQMIGDEEADSSGTDVLLNDYVTAQYRVIYHPRAAYSNAAKDTCVTGAVRTKIVLLSNGSVGSVTPITSLPFGLTEEAVKAAKKIVFLPKVAAGKSASIIVTREYTFTIY